MAAYQRFVRPDQVQTPIHHYRHPSTGRQVTVISTMTVGEPAYYTHLRAVIDELTDAGAVVQAEGSRLLPYRHTTVTDAEAQLLADLRDCRDLEQRRTRELGWVGQVDGLGYPSHWKVIDLTDLQVLRLIGEQAMTEQIRRMRRQFDWPESDAGGIHRYRLSTTIYLRASTRSRRLDDNVKADPTYALLLGARTSTALDGLATTDLDTVLVWSAMHLPGIEAGLTARGYTRTGEPQWVTVAHVPTIRSALWRCLTRSRSQAPAAQG
ncbi:hypothetical protein [Dactylosporangium matsuzakiense]|uniref:Uncharacterized protein n=1 Tax=Dactylosporangium matsuzakiense TaxID=53360 RepID=A0A9W6KPJ8_9ACTN|nr:hypothetical protein [Dactylosporangium matsuzakiense]UWZ44675.1 hypothetical protein Dmats_46355 [Dactylosporangium matsuzakiense]GLL04695.1 hypothetical protein GCM10017581_064420 [Dactylosporangium matsuzakiense]